MPNVTTRRRPRHTFERGYTLIEMVLSLSIMIIVGGVASHVILQSMKVYSRTVPATDAAYQVSSSIERMKREIRAMKDRESLTEMTSTALSFENAADETISYEYSGGMLTRNGDLLAEGVTSFSFEYWQADGTAAITKADLRLLEIDLTVERGGQVRRMHTAVFPRVLGHD